MSKLEYSKDFNFENKELSILRSFLKQNEYKIVLVGSFALYVIKNPHHHVGLSLKFNDLDVDFYKSLKSEIVKSALLDKNKDERIAFKVNDHFSQLVDEIETHDNVSKVEIWLLEGVIEEREGNKGAYGGKLLFAVFDAQGIPHHIYVDVNFENKEFDIDVDKFKIENETYMVRTYVYEKLLADKYLAINKMFKYTYVEVLKNLQNHLNRKVKKLNNIIKLWKDIYDIIFIKNIRTIDMGKVKKYILVMNKYELNLDAIHEFIEIIKNKHPNVTKSRIDYEDISLIVLENYTKLYNKQRKLN